MVIYAWSCVLHTWGLIVGGCDRWQEPMLHFRETSNRGEYTAFQKAAVALKTFEVTIPNLQFFLRT